jgi:hypothetical protein
MVSAVVNMVPVSALVNAVPVNAVPVNAVPVNAVPVNMVPVSAVPVSALVNAVPVNASTSVDTYNHFKLNHCQKVQDHNKRRQLHVPTTTVTT